MATTPTRKRRPATKAAKPAPSSKKNARRADDSTVAARRDAVLKRIIRGGESAAVVAKDLGITTGKAAFIKMQLLVENGGVPAIPHKGDAQLVANTVKARDKADEFSSWGWLSARTGVSETILKQKVAAAGYDVAGTKIASVRKAARPTPVKTTRKPAAAKAAKSTKTRTRRATADPS